jgi:glycosyltransferase involved in cell wall biosynthesis
MLMTVNAIHQMMAGFSPADAISNHARQIRARLRGWGYRSDVFAEHIDPALRRDAKDYQQYEGDPNAVVIFHYSIGTGITDRILRIPDTVALYFHNITPPDLVRRFDPKLAAELERGWQDLRRLRHVEAVATVSRFNAVELQRLGFASPAIIPCFLETKGLLAETLGPAASRLISAYGDDDRTNLLFVGRIAPNKCQDDLLRLLAHYQRWIDPRVRLFLVGGDFGGGQYRVELELLAEELGVTNVHLCGRVSMDELAAYYRLADVYVSMSEHEGFGIPLIEAMMLGVPVLAYAKAAVPETLGGGGVLFHHKDYSILAEMTRVLATDVVVRERVVAVQKQRAEAFSASAVEEKLRSFVEYLVADR